MFKGVTAHTASCVMPSMEDNGIVWLAHGMDLCELFNDTEQQDISREISKLWAVRDAAQTITVTAEPRRPIETTIVSWPGAAKWPISRPLMKEDVSERTRSRQECTKEERWAAA